MKTRLAQQYGKRVTPLGKILALITIAVFGLLAVFRQENNVEADESLHQTDTATVSYVYSSRPAQDVFTVVL